MVNVVSADDAGIIKLNLLAGNNRGTRLLVSINHKLHTLVSFSATGAEIFTSVF